MSTILLVFIWFTIIHTIGGFVMDMRNSYKSILEHEEKMRRGYIAPEKRRDLELLI